jgi:hypothetical protein
VDPAVKPRSLWPREHGAYAQLGAPLATALALAVPTPAAVVIAVAATCAFFANEPLLVVLGHRGRRLKDEHGRRAAWRLAIAGGAAVAIGATGLALAPRDAVIAAGAVAVPTAALLVLAWRRAEHSLAGELVAAVALSGASAPVAVASGIAERAAIELWAAWAVGYACSVVAVHRVIARHRRPASRVDAFVVAGLAAVLAAVIAAASREPIAAVAVPLAAIATAVSIRPPPATRLRAIGVVLVVASIASGAIALASPPVAPAAASATR